jgi:acyl-CoA thioester hydrolase
MARDDFAFAHRFRVRWAEVDPQNIVFNGNYLTYFDVGMTEYLRALGFAYPQGLLALGVDTFVVKATVEYHSPAFYDDELDCCVRIPRIGRTSLPFAFELYRVPAPGGEASHVVSGENIYVCADPATRAPRPVPEPLRVAVRAFERMQPIEL